MRQLDGFHDKSHWPGVVCNSGNHGRLGQWGKSGCPLPRQRRMCARTLPVRPKGGLIRLTSQAKSWENATEKEDLEELRSYIHADLGFLKGKFGTVYPEPS